MYLFLKNHRDFKDRGLHIYFMKLSQHVFGEQFHVAALIIAKNFNLQNETRELVPTAWQNHHQISILSLKPIIAIDLGNAKLPPK